MNSTIKIGLLLSLSIFISTGCSKKNDNEPDSSSTTTTTTTTTGNTTATVTDVNGNTYQTITIGTQTWMTENLKTTKYNDGTAIPNVTNATTWSKLTTGAYCDYNNTASNGAKYGHLYNWYAVGTGKLAPKGWHVATNAEWTTLETYVKNNLGTSTTIKKALAATTGWDSSTYTSGIGYNVVKNNSTGFTALAAGECYDGTFDGIGSLTEWWCSDNSTDDGGRCIILDDGPVFHDGGDKIAGFSIRCIKD